MDTEALCTHQCMRVWCMVFPMVTELNTTNQEASIELVFVECMFCGSVPAQYSLFFFEKWLSWNSCRVVLCCFVF